MEKRGFTLIELLAVIVILAVIALIATPMVLDTIDKSKEGAASSSTYTYVSEVETRLSAYMLKNNGKSYTPGKYDIATLQRDLGVKVKGNYPTNGQVIIEGEIVLSARLCVDNYSIDYSDSKAEISNNNYCGKEVILNIKEEEIKLNVAQEVEFDITGKDISDVTNIVCNNGAKVGLEDNKVIVSNVIGNTICTMNTSLETTVNNLDGSENYILMVNDQSLENSLTILQDKEVTLELNGKTISSTSIAIDVHGGNLNLLSNSVEGTIKSTVGVVVLWEESLVTTENVKIISSNTEQASAIYTKGKLIVNNNTYIKGPTGIGGHESDNSITIINGGTIISTSRNAIQLNTGYKGTLFINGGEIIGEQSGIQNNGGAVNINQDKNAIYISSISKSWTPVIRNSKGGTINIKGNIANECTNNYTKTTSGLCIYAEGDGDSSRNTGNGAIQNNSTGIINIDGGTYYGLHQSCS